MVAGSDVGPLAARSLSRFLVRASVWLTGMLMVWWFALQIPMLAALRVSEEVTLGILRGDSMDHPIVEEPSGDWTFRIAVDDGVVEKAGAVKIRSVRFTMPRADVVLFTFSMPFFWAMVLAMGLERRALRTLLWGTAAMAMAEVLLFFAFLEISACGLVTQFHPAADGFAKWWRDFAGFLVVNVMPFALPIAAALVFDRGLRAQVLPAFANRGAREDL